MLALLTTLSLASLAQECAPTVAPQTMSAIVKVESSANPYAIGVVGGRLQRQPRSHAEAVATAKALETEGWNFSVGIAQVNRSNLTKQSLSYTEAFDPCTNMRAGSKILEDCYTRALRETGGDAQRALQLSYSCYYSGNFKRGFRPDRPGEPSYVQKVLAQTNTAADVKPIPVVPAVPASNSKTEPRASAQNASEKPLIDHSPVLLQRAKDSPPETTDKQEEQGAGSARSVVIF